MRASGENAGQRVGTAWEAYCGVMQTKTYWECEPLPWHNMRGLPSAPAFKEGFWKFPTYQTLLYIILRWFNRVQNSTKTIKRVAERIKRSTASPKDNYNGEERHHALQRIEKVFKVVTNADFCIGVDEVRCEVQRCSNMPLAETSDFSVRQ